VSVLPGVHETPGTLQELREIIESFGLSVRFLPDISSSLDGHIPDLYVGTSLGGATVDEIATMGEAEHIIALGEHMRAPAEAMQKRTGLPVTVLSSIMGLGPSDELIALLSRVSGRPVPERVRRQRSQLIDAMLDAHFYLSGRRIAIAADPGLLCPLTELLTNLGAEVVVAVSSTRNHPKMDELPCSEVHVGDLGDLETLARAANAELLVGPSHGRQASEALGVPLFRIGFPIFDRIGHQHRRLGGYRGTRELVYEFANIFLGEEHEPRPSDFRDLSVLETSDEMRHKSA
jgi:nitrogenase molybdenum-iron protein NifN